MYDVIIIGSGPAGLTAAIYGKRAALNVLMIEESPLQGGQMLNTYEIDNYPGLPNISGMELGERMRQHAKSLETPLVRGRVIRIEDEGKSKRVVTDAQSYQAKCVVLALGAGHATLDVPGEEALGGMGVSYCATCDGAFFKGCRVAVIGGGNVALEDALFLARGCAQVYLIHRRDTFRGAKTLQQQVEQTENITICYNTVVEEILGEDEVEGVLLYDKEHQERRRLEVEGVFIAVGIVPGTTGIEGLPQTDEKGYLVAGEDGVTSIPGIFAAGDCRTKRLRQVVTAVADGANAMTSAEHYIYGQLENIV